MPGEKTGQSEVLSRSFAHQFVTLFFAKLWWLILCVFRPVAVALGMWCCAVVAAFGTYLLYGDKGRPITQGGVILALLLLAFAIFLRRTCRLSIWAMVAGLILAECITLATIGGCSGEIWFEIFDPSNLQWLAYMNLFIGLPWALGMAIGSIWLKLSAASHTCEIRS
jgi:hypothetical protein